MLSFSINSLDYITVIGFYIGSKSRDFLHALESKGLAILIILCTIQAKWLCV